MTITTWRPVFGGGALLFASLAACVGDDPVATGGSGNASSGSTTEPGAASSSSSSGEAGSSGSPSSSSSSSGAALDAAADGADGSDDSACAVFCEQAFGMCTANELGFTDDAECRGACSRWAPGSSNVTMGNTLACRKHQMTLPGGTPRDRCAALGDPSSVCKD